MDFLLIVKYIFLGLLQGFTEPIPISSSGHLAIAQELMGIEIEGLGFEVIVNLASLLAVLLLYRNDVLKISKNSMNFLFSHSKENKNDFLFVAWLIVATIPAGIFGLTFGEYISTELAGMKIIGITLLITAVALWLIRNLKGSRGEHEITFKDAVIIGLAQSIALIPGISRSGATIVAALGLGLKQETALKFSFFLYIPVSLGAGILGFKDLINEPKIEVLLLPYLLSFICAFVMSYFSLKWFMSIMAKGNLKIFSFYCVIVGLSIILFL